MGRPERRGGGAGQLLGSQEKMHRALFSIPAQGVQDIFVLSLSSPPLMVVTWGQGSLPVLSICDIYSSEQVGFPPRPTRGLLGPLQPAVLAEPSQRGDVPVAQG